MIYFLIAVIGLFIASYTDIKKREVPEVLTIGLIVAGLSLHAIESMLSSNYSSLISSAYMTILAFVFSFFLYKMGAWAGGDVKLFTGLAAVLPTLGRLDYAPFLVFAVSFLAALPFVIIYIAYFFITVKRLRQIMKPIIIEDLKRALLPSLIFIISSIASYALTNEIVLAKSFLLLFFVSFIALFGFQLFKIARENILRETVKARNLKEGMIPAEDVYIRGVKVADSRLARGLTVAETKKLKKVRNSIRVKTSMPFVPVMALGLVILFILEKVIK